MPKKGKKQQESESESQELEDVIAWGNRKQNYYQQSENEDSSLEEEELEANKIYQNQFEQLGNEEYYELPEGQEHKIEEREEEQYEDKAVSYEYLTKEIKKMTKLGIKISEEADSHVKHILQTHIQSYLMTLIAIRDLKIPFLEHHPILTQASQLKEDIRRLNSIVQATTQNDVEEEQLFQDQEREDFENVEDIDEEQFLEEADHNEQLARGLKLYTEEKQKQEQAKKNKKLKREKQFQQNKKPVFAVVQEKEGRLASEKILKNKGLMKKRKKIDRNSRVKHRRKFSKASSKRRAYGHFLRQNPGRQYEGERNIKYGRKVGTKLK